MIRLEFTGMTERVTCGEDIGKLNSNSIKGSPCEWGSFSVEFAGKGNVLLIEEDVRLRGGRVRFGGDNGIVVLRGSRHAYYLDVTVWANALFYADRNCYFNGQLHAVSSEGRYIILGRDCLFAFGIWLRTADPHLVYDAKSRKRINQSKDIIVGDHVWVGQDAMILKGTEVGSGSIIGAKSLVSGKRVPSNTSWGGNPAKTIRSGIFWDGASVHNWDERQTKEALIYPDDRYVFEKDEATISGGRVLDAIRFVGNTDRRVEAIRDLLMCDSKNRFFIPE